jgi:tetratricopeptide (TPR) repeat protein
VRGLNDELGAVVGSALCARVGIHTGTVVIAETSDGRPFGFGFAVNFAAKVQAAAALETVMASEATLAVLREPVTTLGQVALPVDGLTGTIDAFEVANTSEPTRAATPMIGRHDELVALADAWKAVSDGAGRVSVLRGAPGVGKTRLARELVRRVETDGRTMWTRCERSRARSPLWPLTQLVRTQIGSVADEPLSGEAIDELANDLGLGARAALLRMALGIEPAVPIELDPLALHREMLATVRSLATAVARNQPTLLVVDDAHWADASTAELIAGFTANPVPGLHVIATAWPEIDTAPLRAAEIIDLEPLTAAESDALVRSFDRVGLAPDRRQEIVDRSEGSPLVIEALVRHGELATGSGLRRALVPKSQVPVMLHAPILARIESITDAPALTRYASAAGLQFDLGLVSVALGLDRSLADDAARALASVDLLRRTELPEIWEFQHSLIRDLAYDAFLTQERCDAHSRIADALRDRGEPDLALLAFHLDHAQRVHDAVDVGLEVGVIARTTGSYAEAEDVLSRTIELLQEHLDIEDAESKLLAAHRNRSFLRVARADNVYGAGEEDGRAILRLLETSRPTYEYAAALASTWGIAMQQGDMPTARNLVARYAEITRDDLPELRALAEAGAGVLASWEGRLGEALALLDRAASGLDGVPWEAPIAPTWATPDHPASSVEAHRGAVLVTMGDIEGTFAAIDRSLAIATSLPWPSGPFSAAYAHAYAAGDATVLSDSARVLQHAFGMQQVANEYGLDFWGKAALVYMAVGGTIANPTLDMVDVLTATSQMLAATGTASILYQAVLIEASRAAIRCAAPDRASSLLAEAIDHAERTTIRCFLPEIRRLMARASEHEAAKIERECGLHLAREQGAVLYEMRLALDIADPAVGTGDLEPLEALRRSAPSSLEAFELARRETTI